MKTIRRLKEAGVPFCGEFRPENLSAAWKELEEWEIACYPWAEEGSYQPRACARIGVRDGGLCVLMYALEPEIQAKETEVGALVCIDSCLEFFFQPVEGDERFVNCEINPLATLHLGIGKARSERTVLRTLPEGIAPVASEHKGEWWAVYYEIPAAFIEETFGKPMSRVIRANCYACGGKDHYGTLFQVGTPNPDFHRPEYFAEIAVEEG